MDHSARGSTQLVFIGAGYEFEINLGYKSVWVENFFTSGALTPNSRSNFWYDIFPWKWKAEYPLGRREGRVVKYSNYTSSRSFGGSDFESEGLLWHMVFPLGVCGEGGGGSVGGGQWVGVKTIKSDLIWSFLMRWFRIRGLFLYWILSRVCGQNTPERGRGIKWWGSFSLPMAHASCTQFRTVSKWPLYHPHWGGNVFKTFIPFGTKILALSDHRHNHSNP